MKYFRVLLILSLLILSGCESSNRDAVFIASVESDFYNLIYPVFVNFMDDIGLEIGKLDFN